MDFTDCLVVMTKRGPQAAINCSVSLGVFGLTLKSQALLLSVDYRL